MHIQISLFDKKLRRYFQFRGTLYLHQKVMQQPCSIFGWKDFAHFPKARLLTTIVSTIGKSSS